MKSRNRFFVANNENYSSESLLNFKESKPFQFAGLD